MSVRHFEDKPATDDRHEVGVGEQDAIEISDVFAILSRRKGWVLGVTALLCAIAAAYVFTATPTYTAVAQVYVDPRDRPTPKEEPAAQNSVPGDGLLLVESQLKIITSNDVLEHVVKQMNLAQDPDFNGERSLTTEIKRLFHVAPTTDPFLEALRNLRIRTAAKRNDRSFVIDISVSAGSPDRAEAITNAVAEAYLAEQADSNADFSRRLSDAITAKLDGMRAAVTRSEEAVAAYKAANNLVGSNKQLVTDEELDQTNTLLTSARARLSEAQARAHLVDTMIASGAQLDALPEVVQSGTIMQLRARAAEISRDQAQLALTVGPKHPALQQIRAQLEDTQTAIRAQVRLIAQSIHNTETAEQTNVRHLQSRFDALKALSKANDMVAVPLHELQRKADSDRAVYETFLAKAKTASEQEVVDTSNIRLISRALPPDRKSWPPTGIVMAAALFAGLSLGVALALALEGFAVRRGAARLSGHRLVGRRAPARASIAVQPK